MLIAIFNKLKDEDYYWSLGFYALILAGTAHIFFIFLFLFLDIHQLVIVNILSVSIYLYCIFGLSIKTLKSKDDSLIGWLVYIELIAHSIAATLYLGPDSGFQYYMYTLVFLPFFVWTYSTSVRLLRIAFIIVIAFLLDWWGHNYSPLIILDTEIINMLHYMNLVLVLVVVSIISYIHTINSKKYQNLLFKQSNKDPLTNLYNRRYIGEISKDDFSSLKDEGINFALLLIDVDNFKKINDIYGHTCGDNALITLSKILKDNVRQSTIISRWGGEEFLIIMENSNENALIHLAERLRSVVENTIMVDPNKIKLTITLGGAISKDNETFQEVLSRADKALYRGKENGKNKVVIDI